MRSAGWPTTRSTSTAPAATRSRGCASGWRASMKAGRPPFPPTGRWPMWWPASPCRAPFPRRCWKASPGMPRGGATTTSPSVHAYSARVAGTVGVMMTLLMGERNPAVVSRACDLGIAMQLSNIARDVGEDARNGRLYLPRDWMREAGLDPDAWLAQPGVQRGAGRGGQAPAARGRCAVCACRRGHRPAAARLPARHLGGALPLCRDRPRGGARGLRFGVAPRRGVGAAQGARCWRARSQPRSCRCARMPRRRWRRRAS